MSSSNPEAKHEPLTNAELVILANREYDVEYIGERAAAEIRERRETNRIGTMRLDEAIEELNRISADNARLKVQVQIAQSAQADLTSEVFSEKRKHQQSLTAGKFREDRIAFLESRNVGLSAALEKYGVHYESCPHLMHNVVPADVPEGTPCNCGLDAELASGGKADSCQRSAVSSEPGIKNPPDVFEDAYSAGRDAATNGASVKNAHFSFFRTRESTDEWQRGYDEHKPAAEQAGDEKLLRAEKGRVPERPGLKQTRQPAETGNTSAAEPAAWICSWCRVLNVSANEVCKHCDHPKAAAGSPGPEADLTLYVYCGSCGKVFDAQEERDDDVCPGCSCEGCLSERFTRGTLIAEVTEEDLPEATQPEAPAKEKT